MHNLPIIFCVDDDAQVLSALMRDLRQKYRDHFRVMGTISVSEALETLNQLKLRGEHIALFISDQRMPEMEGVEFLTKAIALFPSSKRVLLTAYSDKTVAIQAINEIGLNYYFIKPWDPPAEKLYPVTDDLLDEWLAGFVPEFKGVKIIGYQYSPLSHEIKNFLASNVIPYKWFEVTQNTEAKELLSLSGFKEEDLPVIIFEDGQSLSKPSISEIASRSGLNSTKPMYDVYDVVVIGAGPAGLASAIYESSKGLKTLLIERWGPGGQAGTSSHIENYLGFPSGITGEEFTRRAMTQARRLGMEFLCPALVTSIKEENGYKKVMLDNDQIIITRSVIVTTGVDYRKLEATGIDNYAGAGVYYGAAMTEAAACKDEEVYIVGGGNSAGQTAMYLSKFAKNVYIVIRRTDLTSSMSAYLIEQLKTVPTITILSETVIKAVAGSDRLEEVELLNISSNKKEKKHACALFIFIGAKPFTDWLGTFAIKDDKGYLETGRNIEKYSCYTKSWKLSRNPYLLETSIPGVFAAGGIRAGAMNRIASAVGEGSMAIKFVHNFLAEEK